MKFKIVEDTFISKDNIIRETPKAILVNDGVFDYWIPKSVITKDEKFAFYVPDWFMAKIKAENMDTRAAWEKRK